MSYSPYRRERGRSRTHRQKCWKLPGNTSGGFNIGYLQLACQSHVTSNICKDINVAHHCYSNIYIQHKEKNCKSLVHGAFRARMELLAKLFVSYMQHIPTVDVQLCRVACVTCCLRALRLQLKRQQFSLVSVLRLFRGLHLRGGANPSRSLPW